MQESKRNLTVLIFGIFSFAEAILPTKASAQNYEDSPFGFHPANVALQGYPNNGFTDAQYIGVKWHRPSVYAFWFIVQPDLADTTLDFLMYDRIYGSVPEDIHILANIAPQGRNDEGYCLPGTWIPIDTLQYTRFVEAAVERYDGDGIDDMPGLTNPIKYWQMGNEPHDNLVSDFATLQRITYRAIKDADSTSMVLIGGVSGFPDNYISRFENIYAPILTELAGDYIDIFDFHWYGTATGEYRLRDSVSGEDVLEHIRATLTANGFPADLPLWITEMGSYSGDPVGPQFPYQTEEQQAGDYLKRFVYPLSRGIEKIFPAFGLVEGFKYDGGYFDFTGLIYDGWGSYDMGIGVKKLAYFSHKKMTEKLEGSDWENVQTINTGVENIYCYRFLKDDTGIHVAWYDYFDNPGYIQGDTIEFILNDINSERVIVTDAVPYDILYSAFCTDTLSVTGGSVQIPLSENPVFIETLSATSIEDETIGTTPAGVRLYQNYPSPFNPVTTISFSTESTDNTELVIYNISGQIVKILVASVLSEGEHSVVWDGTDENNQPAGSGVYFCQLRVGNGPSATSRMVLLK